MSHHKDQYEPGDSRRVTLTESDLAIEPERTGPREDEARPDHEERRTAIQREPTAEELRKGG